MIHVSKKCSETLKKYLKIHDEMIELVNKEFAKGFEYRGLSDSERKCWEYRSRAVQLIEDLSDSKIELKSTKEILRKSSNFERIVLV